MADASINITVDEEALRKQVQDILSEELEVVAMRLRFAADRLDPDFENRLNKYIAAEYERGVRDGRENNG